MAHVPAHRWADLAAGRLPGAQARRIEEHAARCARCATQRERVTRAMAAFAGMRDAPAPSIGWEHVGARVYWAVSSERRKSRRSAPVWVKRAAWVAVPVTSVAAMAALLLAYVQTSDAPADAPDRKAVLAAHIHDRTVPGQPAAAELPARPGTSESAPIPVPIPVQGLVTFLQGEVMLHDEPLGFDALLGKGDRITTGQGKVAIQFGKDSALALAEDSALVLAEFDEGRVELAIEGTVFVDVTRRGPEQSFVVRAGTREVHVRGTSFGVEHRGGRLRVACGHGEVAVLNDSGQVTISAGQVVQWIGNELRPGTLELAEMDRMQREVVRLPAWADARTLRDTSSTLQIAASANRAVDIDGVTVGSGSFAVRVMSGRHHLGGEGVPGRWIELDPGQAARAPVQPLPGASIRGRKQRQTELVQALGQGNRVEGCIRALRKQGLLHGAFIVLELGILRDGTIEHLNILDTNLPRSTARCVRDVIDEIDFAGGPAATLQHRVSW